MNTIESLNKNSDFKKVYKRGKSKVGKHVVVYILKNNLNKNRLGITVSKKLGNAVKRNRARRVIKEAYRLNCKDYKVGFDIVLVGRSRSIYSKTVEVQVCLNNLMKDQNMCVKTQQE